MQRKNPSKGESRKNSRRPAVIGLLDRNDSVKAVLATSKAIEEGHTDDLGSEVMIRVLKAGFVLSEKPRFMDPLERIAQSLAPKIDKRVQRHLTRLACQHGYDNVAGILTGVSA